jgi:hypothetical protein
LRPRRRDGSAPRTEVPGSPPRCRRALGWQPAPLLWPGGAEALPDPGGGSGSPVRDPVRGSGAARRLRGACSPRWRPVSESRFAGRSAGSEEPARRSGPRPREPVHRPVRRLRGACSPGGSPTPTSRFAAGPRLRGARARTGHGRSRSPTVCCSAPGRPRSPWTAVAGGQPKPPRPHTPGADVSRVRSPAPHRRPKPPGTANIRRRLVPSATVSAVDSDGFRDAVEMRLHARLVSSAYHRPKSVSRFQTGSSLFIPRARPKPGSRSKQGHAVHRERGSSSGPFSPREFVVSRWLFRPSGARCSPGFSTSSRSSPSSSRAGASIGPPLTGLAPAPAPKGGLQATGPPRRSGRSQGSEESRLAASQSVRER